MSDFAVSLIEKAALHSCYFTGPDLLLAKVKIQGDSVCFDRRVFIFIASFVLNSILGLFVFFGLPFCDALLVLFFILFAAGLLAYITSLCCGIWYAVKDGVIVSNNVNVKIVEIFEVVYFKSSNGGEISPGIYVNTPFDACLIRFSENKVALAYKGNGCEEMSRAISKLAQKPMREVYVNKL